MSEAKPREITRLLQQWNDGDDEALQELMPLIYDELRKMASIQLRRERPDHTFQSAALANEAYIRLVGLKQVDSRSRVQFFSLTARIIRNILIDHARRKQSAKRGSGGSPLSLDQVLNVSRERAPELEELDDALASLAAIYPQQAKIVVWHSFVGLTYEEIAHEMSISVSTATRGWRIARAWLYRHLVQDHQK